MAMNASLRNQASRRLSMAAFSSGNVRKADRSGVVFREDSAVVRTRTSYAQPSGRTAALAAYDWGPGNACATCGAIPEVGNQH